MNQLFTYIEAISNSEGAVNVLSNSTTDLSYIDQGVRVNNIENMITFSDGVVIKHSVEFDEVKPSDEVCAECWITYEVIESIIGEITPMKKMFTNKCQESFWLRIQQHRSS